MPSGRGRPRYRHDGVADLDLGVADARTVGFLRGDGRRQTDCKPTLRPGPKRAFMVSPPSDYHPHDATRGVCCLLPARQISGVISDGSCVELPGELMPPPQAEAQTDPACARHDQIDCRGTGRECRTLLTGQRARIKSPSSSVTMADSATQTHGLSRFMLKARNSRTAPEASSEAPRNRGQQRCCNSGFSKVRKPATM